MEEVVQGLCNDMFLLLLDVIGRQERINRGKLKM
jgi:hypothetical protein